MISLQAMFGGRRKERDKAGGSTSSSYVPGRETKYASRREGERMVSRVFVILKFTKMV